MQPVLDAPMAPHQAQQLTGGHLVRREAADEVAGLMAARDARDGDVQVDSQDQLDAGEGGRLADVGDLLALHDPDPAGVDLAPFFSAVFTSGGRSAASRKLART